MATAPHSTADFKFSNIEFYFLKIEPLDVGPVFIHIK